MKRIEEIRALRAQLEKQYEALDHARNNPSLTDEVRGVKMDMIRREIERLKGEIKKLGA